jgi:starch synthase (maltosyl-transferring)
MKELQTSPMKPLGNNHWRDEFSVEMLGRYQYTVEGWIDRFQTWRGELLKRVAAGQDVYVDLLIGAVLIDEAAGRARGDDAGLLRDWAGRLREAKDRPEGADIALEEEPLGVLQRYPVYRP